MAWGRVATLALLCSPVHARDQILENWESDQKILLNLQDQKRTNNIEGPPSFFMGERAFTKDNPALDHDNGGLELAQQWEHFMDERDSLGGEGPDRIEIFIRTMGSVEDGPGCTVAHAPLDNSGIYDGYVNLPNRGPALVWCPLYAMPEYVNSIKAKTKVVVFIAGGVWALTHPIPRIKHDVHIVGSDIPGRDSDVVAERNGVASKRVTDPQRLRQTFHERAKHRSSYIDEKDHEHQGTRYILSTVIDGGDEVGIWHFGPHLRVKMENICMIGGSAEQGGAVYVEEMTRLPMIAGGSLKMVNCDLVHNHALFGGAIYAGAMGVDVDRTAFTGNLASSCGGAVYVVDGNPIHASYSVFSHNYDRCSRVAPNTAHNPMSSKAGKAAKQEPTLLEKGNGRSTADNPQQIDTSGAISIGRPAQRDSPSDYRQERHTFAVEDPTVEWTSGSMWERVAAWSGFGTSLVSPGGPYKPDEPWWAGCEELWQANSNGLDPLYAENGGGGRGIPRTYRTDEYGSGASAAPKKRSRMSLSKKGREKQRLEEERRANQANVKAETTTTTTTKKTDRQKNADAAPSQAAGDDAGSPPQPVHATEYDDDDDGGPTTDLRGINEALGFAPKGSGAGAPMVLKKGVYVFKPGKGLMLKSDVVMPPTSAPQKAEGIQITVPTPISPSDGKSFLGAQNAEKGIPRGLEESSLRALGSQGAKEGADEEMDHTTMNSEDIAIVYDDDLEDFALELDYDDDGSDMPSFGSGSPFVEQPEQRHSVQGPDSTLTGDRAAAPPNGGLIDDPSDFFGRKL